MQRFTLAIVLALTGILALGSVAQSLPAAHAQANGLSLAMPKSVGVGGKVTISGNHFTANNWVYVYFQRPDGTTNSAYVQTNGYGQFTFNLGFSAAHGTGAEYVWVYDFGTRRWSPALTIIVTSGIPVPVRQIHVSSLTVAPGHTITVSGQGFTSNGWVYVYFQRPNGSTGAYWVQADANGSFSSLLGFEIANGCGSETLWAYDNATQQWGASAVVTVTGCGSLSAPSNLQVVSVAKGQPTADKTTVALHWNDNSTAETGFRVRATFTRLYGGTDGQQWDVGANTMSTSVTFVSGGINPVKTACFTVSALNGNAESAPSNQPCVQL